MPDFLITEVPHDAEFCTRQEFLHAFPLGDDQFDIDRLLNGLQVVDTRLTEDDLRVIEETPPRSEHSRFFEIKDIQESPKRGEALCSLSLFKMDAERGTTGKTFDVYLDGLKQKIHHFRHESPNQKLRVYIGDSAWDEVHRAGCFEAADVDFVRMKESSRRTEIGTLWRFLAFDDYDYPFVYISETDGHGKFVDDEWVVDEKGHWGCTLPFLETGTSGGMHMATKILPMPAPETRKNSIPEDFPFLFWVEDYRLSDPLFIHRLSEYIQSATPEMLRGPKRLPFSDISRILCHHLARGDERILYHPESNLWTNIRERQPNLNFRYIDDQWLFHLTKVLRVKHWINPGDLGGCYSGFRRYGENWFFKRLCDALVADGNMILVGSNDELGYPFEMSDATWKGLLNGNTANFMDRIFFLDKLLDYTDYSVSPKFVHKLAESREALLNESYMRDPRITDADLERITSSELPDHSRIFNIVDMQESKSGGKEALCSICIWKSDQAFFNHQPFSDYLEGLGNRIEHYRRVQPDHTLRVYVGDSAWEEVHKAGYLKANHVDFVRMGISSSYSTVGLMWRPLAFDDYRYEYVYMDDTDDRFTIIDDKKVKVDPLVVDKHILERRMSTPDESEVHIAAALSFANDKAGDFFHETPIDLTHSHIPTPFYHLYAPYSYYETAVLTITRGPRKMPFNTIVPILCEVLNRRTKHLLYHAPSNKWSSFNELVSTLQDYSLDESWVFYMSKLLDVKMWILPHHMEYVEQIMKRYGHRCFWKRIHEQMILEGNHLACGDQGVDEFSFDRFLE